MATQSPVAPDLRAHLEALGAEIGAREAGHRESMDRARSIASRLHDTVVDALAGFHDAVSAAGAPHLRLEVSPPELDQKHIRAIEFEVSRGRIVGIVTVKARGDVTLVGPFRRGKNEGPCRSIASEESDALDAALTEFVGTLVEEASAP